MNIFSKALLATLLALPLVAQDNGPCSIEHPARTPSDVPTPTENRLDDALLLAVKFGDKEALAQLKHRHDTAFTWCERQSIAASLLGQIDNDSEYWNELYEDAKNAVRFAKKSNARSAELEAWCAARRCDPDDYNSMALDALTLVLSDPRSHDLMIRALASEDWSTVGAGIIGLAEQHDEASLPLIEEAIRRSDAAPSLASYLAAFYSDAADAIAMRYLLPDQIDSYKQMRDETGEYVHCLEGREPRHLLDHPTCADEKLNSVLIAAAGRGERSAIKPLMERYETSTTLIERHRIAKALLHRVKDDSVYWDDLFAFAENAVDLKGTGLFAADYEQVAESAFTSVVADPRSRLLLLHAIKDSPNEWIVYHAIDGLAHQHDESSLPLMEQAIQRFPGNLAMALYAFRGAAADSIARRNLGAIDYEIYEMWRDDTCWKDAQ